VLRKHRSFQPILNILSLAGVIKSYQEFPLLLVIQLNSPKALGSIISYNNQTLKIINLSQRRESGCILQVVSTDRGVKPSLISLAQSIGGKVLFKIT
jgi:hypothetical protein